MKHGAAVLGTLAEDAGRRLIESGMGRTVWQVSLSRKQLFTDEERQQLADALAATNATAELLGRARIRRRAEQAATKHVEKFSEIATDFTCFDDSPLRPLTPLRALEFFRSLIPILGIKDPGRWGEDQHRAAFTLAEATEQVLLEKIQNTLARSLETGVNTKHEIEKLLDNAGVTPKNPQYAEMVFRTNMMDSYNTGSTEEMRDPDLQEAFPVWRYDGIDDGRQGKDHAPHFGKYYPNNISFSEVRGKRVFNCRCTSTPIYKDDWAELQKQGQQVSRFSEEAKVSLIPQQKDYSCGAAALLAVCKRFGLGPQDEAGMRSLLGTNADDGTQPQAMVEVARKLGLSAEAHERWKLPQLERSLLLGRPVVCCLQFGPAGEAKQMKAGHWMVATGRQKGVIEFMDPASGETVEIAKSDLPRLWVDKDGDGRRYVRFGMAVSKETL